MMRASEIKENPLASAEDLAWLKSQDPVAALSHPNCPPDIWWALAVDNPIEAIGSMLYPMFMLESPERWAILETKCLSHWVSLTLRKLPNVQAQLFAADCVEHVLPIYETANLNDQTVRESVAQRRSFARGGPIAKFWRAAATSSWGHLHGAQDAIRWSVKMLSLPDERQDLLRWQWLRIQQYAKGLV